MAGIPINTILGALPEDLKPKGLEKLPQLLMSEGLKVDGFIQPSIEKLAQELGISPDVDLNSLPCLTTPQLEAILLQRDNLINTLNGIGRKLDSLSLSLTGIQNFLSLTSAVLLGISITKTGLSLASKFLPITPGAIPSAISDLDDLKTSITFNSKGKSRLQPIQDTINASALSISVVNQYITQAILLIQSIDLVLKRCLPNHQLVETSNTIEGIVELTLKADQTSTLSSYKGFILDIVEEPYTPTVNRRKAVGINQYGIIMISTPLSFTTNGQTLINELKLIIDRDNLKAD